MRIVYSILTWCLSIIVLGAQTVTPATTVRQVIELFGNKSKGLWVQLYSGIGSRGERYVLALGHDQTDCKGIIKFIDRNDSLYLEGRYDPNQLKLVMQDQHFEHKGFLIAGFFDSGLRVQIMTARKETGSYIEFVKVNREGYEMPQCALNHWYQSFSGIMDRDPIKVQLQSDVDQRIYGTLSKPDKLTGYMLSGECEEPDCKKMNVVMHDFFGERVKEFHLKKIDDRHYQADELFKNATLISENWESEQRYVLKCKNVNLPGIRIYAEYLHLNDREFDLWLNAFLNKWIEQVVSYYQNTPVENTKSFSCYMDIDWITKDWVSGIFRFAEPWSDGDRNLSFTFDRKSGRVLGIDELFDSSFDYKMYFEEYISWKKQEMASVNTSGRFKLYLQNEGFKHWTLRPEGFSFSSDFSRIWGNRKIIIPYSLLAEKIRKTGPLKRIY